MPGDEYRSRREDGHLAKFPAYPDVECYLSYYQKCHPPNYPSLHVDAVCVSKETRAASSGRRYLFRNEALVHLRVEQVNRYFTLAEAGAADLTLDGTLTDDEAEGPPPDEGHRHFDEQSESVAAGTAFPGLHPGVGTLRRRKLDRLGVARTAFLEPLGEKREAFYEQRLALTFPWRCVDRPEPLEGGGSRWRVVWDPPSSASLGGAELPRQEIVLEPGVALSFELFACDLELLLCRAEHGLVCPCCLGALPGSACESCRFAVGLHRCQAAPQHLRWRKGCLHGGSLDAQRVLWNLHRKGLPIAALRDKALAYEVEGRMSQAHAAAVLLTIEQERGMERLVNEPDGEAAAAAAGAEHEGKLTRQQLEAELKRRESNMQSGGSDEKPTDQWRVYVYIVRCLEHGPHLRLLVQAAAGTGKSYVLTSVYLWCLLNGKRCKAAAPTGIASANVSLEGTDVRAATLHNMFDFDGDFRTSLDFAKPSNRKVAALIEMEVCLIDEFSMRAA
jgi:AAA domain